MTAVDVVYLPKWVDMGAASQLLGGMDYRSVMNLARSGVIRFCKPNRKYMFSTEDIDRLDERLLEVQGSTRRRRSR